MAIVDYLIKQYPGNRFTLQGSDYSTLEWYEDNPSPKPSEQEFLDNLGYEPEPLSDEAIAAKIIAAQKLAYIHQRAAEYPPITDYIDGVVKGDQAQIDKYISDCLAVKAKYPKGTV